MTIRELAKRLRLGKTTVADALRGGPEVSAKTRERVLAKAKEWGYEPNPLASAFLRQVRSRGSRGRRCNLALLIPWAVETSIHSLGHNQRLLYEGACLRAKELGYTLDALDPFKYGAARLDQIVASRGIFGVAVAPRLRAVGHMTMDWSKVASVALGYSMTRPALHRVVHNHLLGIQTAFRQCRRKGFERIGLALSEEGDMRSNGLWMAGFWKLQQKLPKNRQVRPLLVPGVSFKARPIAAWMTREKPDVVIFHNAAVIPRLPDLAGDRPKTAIVLLDRLSGDAHAGIDQLYAEAGGMLVEVLSLQIFHNERGVPVRPNLIQIEGEWVDRPPGGSGA